MATRSRTTAPPTPTPGAIGDTVSIIAFGATNPTLAAVQEGDGAKLAEGAYLSIVVTAGTLPEVDGLTGQVTNLAGDTFNLSFDLSATDPTGVTATGTVTEEPPDPPVPPPIPDPGASNHAMASMSPGVTTIWHPSPGVNGIRVEDNPEDVAPGTSAGDQWAPDPDNPLGPPISNAEALARYRALLGAQPPMPPAFPPELEPPPPPPSDPEVTQGFAEDFDAIAQREGIE